MILPRITSMGVPAWLEKGIPEAYRGFLLSAETWFSDDPFGLLIIQQEFVHDKWLRYYYLRPTEKITISFEGDERWLELFINLGSAFSIASDDGPGVQVKQIHFLLGYGSEKAKSIVLNPGEEYRFLEVWYERRKVGDFELSFPVFENLPERAWRIAPKSMDAIETIIKNAFTETTVFIYYDIVLVLVLFLLLSQFPSLPGIKASDIEIAAVEKAKALLVENIRVSPVLKNIARAVGLSEYRFNVLFRELYAQSPFEFFMNVKMDRAYQLVTTTDDSIKSIAVDTGYKWAMNFVTAFRERFGEAPETLRQSLRNAG